MRRRRPIHISPCPIAEAVFEIRYTSIYPSDAIFGIIYTSVRDLFPKSQPEALPILQLPEVVRNRDPNFIYQAHHRLTRDNFNLSIGPRTIAFGTVAPYPGWEQWSSFFHSGLAKIQESAVIGAVERVGLRYLNIFDQKLFDKIELSISVADKALLEESTNLRTEILDSGFVKILQVGNLVNLNINNMNKTASIIDIDCIHALQTPGLQFHNDYRALVDLAHEKEKDLFFDLLKDSFIKQLNPKYEEEA